MTQDPRHHIVQKAVTDAAFRQALVANPAATIARELGVPIPPGVAIRVVEDTADTVHLVLPAAESGRELTEAELQSVAGGTICAQWVTWDGCTT